MSTERAREAPLAGRVRESSLGCLVLGEVNLKSCRQPAGGERGTPQPLYWASTTTSISLTRFSLLSLVRNAPAPYTRAVARWMASGEARS